MKNAEEHAADLEKIARNMEAAGIGLDLDRGHVVVLRRMAADLRAEAAGGDVVRISELSAMSTAVLAGAGIEMTRKIAIEQLDAALAKSGIAPHQRILLKTELAHAGLIE
jgi:hypothetical protein